jgi:hypothetical protein
MNGTLLRRLPTFARKLTIIGLGLFHFCVRNGNRWNKPSIAATKMHNWCGDPLQLLIVSQTF